MKQAEAPNYEGPLNLAKALQDLEKALPANTIYTTDAGNFRNLAHAFSCMWAPGRISSGPPMVPWAMRCRQRLVPRLCIRNVQ